MVLKWCLILVCFHEKNGHAIYRLNIFSTWTWIDLSLPFLASTSPTPFLEPWSAMRHEPVQSQPRMLVFLGHHDCRFESSRAQQSWCGLLPSWGRTTAQWFSSWFRFLCARAFLLYLKPQLVLVRDTCLDLVHCIWCSKYLVSCGICMLISTEVNSRVPHLVHAWPLLNVSNIGC